MKTKFLFAFCFAGFIAFAQQTTNYVTKFGASPPAAVNSLIYDDGTNLGIGTTTPDCPLYITRSQASSTHVTILNSSTSTNSNVMARVLCGNGTSNFSAGIFGINATTSGMVNANSGFVTVTTSAADLRVYTQTTQPLIFGTNNAEVMRMTSGGNVGIGTTSPGGQFELSLDQGRKPSTSLWTITSDARLKNIEGNYTKGLKEVLLLKPIVYHYKNVGTRVFSPEVLKTQNIGFAAQEVQKVFPEAVGIDQDGYLNFNMHSIIVAFVNAFKEQQEMITNLQNEIAALKNQTNSTGSPRNNSPLASSKLHQNIPNPASETTVINFDLAIGSTNAIVYIYDLQGKQISSYAVNGKNNLQIRANEFDAGMYMYALVVDGNLIDTKHMILTK